MLFVRHHIPAQSMNKTYYICCYATYSKKLDSSIFHEFCLVWHVLEVLGVVEKLFLLSEKYLPKFDGKFSTLFQPWKDYPVVTKIREDILTRAQLCYPVNVSQTASSYFT